MMAGGVVMMMTLSGSAWVNLTLVRPSEIRLPEHIRTIALIDRTLQDDTPQNIIEQTLTGEYFRQDEQAVFQAAEGFIEACAGLEKYLTVRTSERYLSDGNASSFPSAMEWTGISEICERHQADAVLSVEIFDTDFIMTNMPVKLEDAGANETGLPKLQYNASGIAVIDFGVRLYDPSTKTILDEYRTTCRMNFQSRGTSLQAAINQMIDKTSAINQASYDAGYRYAQRITPTYFVATRYFYDRPKRVLGTGVRKSEVADWQGAMNSWMKVIDTGSERQAGRAAYNIAVAYEVLGDLEKAREWASRSYTDYRDKRADDYYKLLSDRIDQEFIADTQLSASP